MKSFFLFSSLLILLTSCGSNTIIFKDPSFENYYIDSKLAETLAQTNDNASPISFNLLEETKDTLNYEKSILKWIKKNNIALKMASFHDDYTMIPLKNNKLSIDWIGKYRKHLVKDKYYALSHVVEQENSVFFFYGSRPNEFHVIEQVTILVIRDKNSEKIKAVFDFKEFAYAPKYAPKAKPFVFQNIHWAAEELGTLYVCHAHSTYASSSEGMNAYITAIDWKKKKILWRSKPLTSNAINFIVRKNCIVSAYGFTREGAKLYALDKKTGKQLGELVLAQPKTGKKHIEYLYSKGDVIYAKSFDNTAYKISIK